MFEQFWHLHGLEVRTLEEHSQTAAGSWVPASIMQEVTARINPRATSAHIRDFHQCAQGPASKLYGSYFAKWEIVPPVVFHSVWFMKFSTSPRVPARLIQVIVMSLDRPVPRRLVVYPIASCKCILVMLVGHHNFKGRFEMQNSSTKYEATVFSSL